MFETIGSKAKAQDIITAPHALRSLQAEEYLIIDNILGRLSSTISGAPYIVHCAGQKYRLGGHHKYNWQTNTTFALDEEYLQHLSFVYRDPVTSCFLLRSEYEEEARRVKLSGGAGSGTVTPLQSQGVKKKISLSAYKNKAKVNGPGTTPAGQEQLCLRKTSDAAVQHMATPKEGQPAGQKVLGASKDDENIEHHPPVASSLQGKPIVELSPNAGQQGQKRLLKDAFDHNNSRSPSSPHPRKKPRMTETLPKVIVQHTEAVSHAAQQVGAVESKNASPPTVERVLDITTEKISGTSVRADLPPWFPRASQRIETSSLPEPVSSRLASDSPNTASSPDFSRPSTTTSVTSISSGGPRYQFQLSQPENGRDANSEQHKTNAKQHISIKAKVVSSNPTVDGIAATPGSPKINPTRSSVRHEHHPSSSLAQATKVTDLSRGLLGLKSTKSTGKPQEQNELSIPSPRLTKIVRKVHGGSSSFFETLKSHGTPANPQIATSQQVKMEIRNKIVRLKYGHNRQKNIERILKRKPIPKQENRPAGESSSQPNQVEAAQMNDDAHVHSKGKDDQAATPEPSKDIGKGTEEVQGEFSSSAPVEKPSRQENISDGHQPSGKRHGQADATLSRSPRTPFAPAAGSPQLTPSCSRTRQKLTPRNDHRPPVMTGAPAIGTQYGPVGTPKVPESAESYGNGSQGALDGMRTDKSLKLWKEELRKLSDLGTAIKRKLQASANPVGQQMTDEEARQSQLQAVQGVESILCFMQAFIAGEQYQSRKEIATNWIVGSFANVKIDGVTSLQSQSDILQKMQANAISMQHHGIESDRLLSRGALEKQYPLTYAEREKLPLWGVGNPMVVVRVGCKFLAEWSVQQEVEWTQQLEEGLCSQL